MRDKSVLMLFAMPLVVAAVLYLPMVSAAHGSPSAHRTAASACGRTADGDRRDHRTGPVCDHRHQRLRDGTPVDRPSGRTRRDRRQSRGARRPPGSAPRSGDLPPGDPVARRARPVKQPGGATVHRGERAAAPAAFRGQAREENPSGFRTALLAAPDRQGAPGHRGGGGAQPHRPSPFSRRRLAGRRCPLPRNHRTRSRAAAARLPHRHPVGARGLSVDGIGGADEPWAAGGKEHPVHLRFGIPSLGETGRTRYRIGPFGADHFVVPGFRKLPAAGVAGGGGRPVDGKLRSRPRGTLSAKRARPRRSRRRIGSQPRSLEPIPQPEPRLITVRAAAGQPYVLQHFELRDRYTFQKSGRYWLGSVHWGHPQDAADATAIVTKQRCCSTARSRAVPFANGRDRLRARMGATLQPARSSHGFFPRAGGRKLRGAAARHRGPRPIRTVSGRATAGLPRAGPQGWRHELESRSRLAGADDRPRRAGDHRSRGAPRRQARRDLGSAGHQIARCGASRSARL